MAVSSRGRSEQWKEKSRSPERTKVWVEPKLRSTAKRKVSVVYYLSRNGHLEHPHFMEVSLSSSEGLYLRDVINRLNFFRGRGMANMYSWSSKRSYKNGFVWHDLSEDDFIYPAHGHEYVLKGSELLQLSSSSISEDTTASSSGSDKALEIPKSIEDESDFPLVRRKKTSWNSLDLKEYKVYKTGITAEIGVKAADASTQTDDRKQRRRALGRDEQRVGITNAEASTVLERDEISPPPSSSSPETLESLIKADGRPITIGQDDQDRALSNYSSGRLRASAVLMHLISCGSISVKGHGFTLVPPYKGRLPRGGSDQETKEMDALMNNPSFSAIRLEDKEYFSGSLIETNKKGSEAIAELSRLKRSSSFNADRSAKLDLGEKAIEGVRARCIPRKAKMTARREAGNPPISRSTHGSKRITDKPPQK